MTLRITENAERDLRDIYTYIALDKPEAALSVLEGLLDLMERLLQFPRMGRAGEMGIRELFSPPFILVYRIVESVVNVEAIFHGNRRYF